MKFIKPALIFYCAFPRRSRSAFSLMNFWITKAPLMTEESIGYSSNMSNYSLYYLPHWRLNFCMFINFEIGLAESLALPSKRPIVGSKYSSFTSNHNSWSIKGKSLNCSEPCYIISKSRNSKPALTVYSILCLRSKNIFLWSSVKASLISASNVSW